MAASMTYFTLIFGAMCLALCTTEEIPITVLLQNLPGDDQRFKGCAKLIKRSPRCYKSKRLYGCQQVENRGDISVFALQIERTMMEKKHQGLYGPVFDYVVDRISNNKAFDCVTVAGNGDYFKKLQQTSTKMTVVGLYSPRFCKKATNGKISMSPTPSACSSSGELPQHPFDARIATYELTFPTPIDGYEAFRIVLGLNRGLRKCRYNGVLDV